MESSRPSKQSPFPNCWEQKRCGREPGGANTATLGICPAAIAEHLTGTNRGLNGGRVCWAIAGTLCNGQVQGSFALKLGNCMRCEFFHIVSQQEGVGDAALLLQGFQQRP